ncbi:hypothetical protein EI94DRAFT_172452 [Lactarius quietus]|nr:hypothetical protein EI94DRAFT_172452 [Lactarius quietus]
MQTIRARGCPIDPPSLAMTYPPPSFRVSGTYFLSHTAPPFRRTHRSPLCTASGPWYLIDSYLPLTYEYPVRIPQGYVQRQATRKAVPERRGIARPRQSGPDMRYQRYVRVISWTFGVSRASYVQGLGNVLSQPRLRTNRFHAILISWCRPVCFSCIKPLHSTSASNFGCASGIIPVFFGTRPPHRMRGSQGFGPT